MTSTATTVAGGRRLIGWRAWLVWLVVVVDIAASLALPFTVNPTSDTPLWAMFIFIAMVASLGMVGSLVVTRQPRNPVGWILWAAATTTALSIVGPAYASSRVAADPVVPPAIVALAWVTSFTFVATLATVVVFVPLLFPNGRLLSPRWRWAVAFTLFALIVGTLPSMFMPGPLSSVAAIQNPFGIPLVEQLKDPLSLANGIGAAIAFLLAIASAVIRYRRGTSVEREQLKWFAAAAALTAVSLVVAAARIGPLADLGWVVGLIGLALLPIAIGIAILRYRLYDIDRIISRTIAYLIVTGILALVFAGAVLLFGAILSPVFGENPVAVAVSTLIVAALFQPLRRRVQSVVDRRFNRARYDAQRTADSFATRLRDQVDLTAVAGDLVATADASLSPASAAVWLREGGAP